MTQDYLAQARSFQPSEYVVPSTRGAWTDPRCRHRRKKLVVTLVCVDADEPTTRLAWWKCLDCGQNARRPGSAVHDDELRERGEHRESLPIDRDNTRTPSVILATEGEPRRDMQADSSLWVELLELAFLADVRDDTIGPSSCFHALWGCRCAGLRLRRKDGAFVLRPEYGPQGLQDAQEWQSMRATYLTPHRAKIEALLRALNDVPVAA